MREINSVTYVSWFFLFLLRLHHQPPNTSTHSPELLLITPIHSIVLDSTTLTSHRDASKESGRFQRWWVVCSWFLHPFLEVLCSGMTGRSECVFNAVQCVYLVQLCRGVCRLQTEQRTSSAEVNSTPITSPKPSQPDADLYRKNRRWHSFRFDEPIIFLNSNSQHVSYRRWHGILHYHGGAVKPRGWREAQSCRSRNPENSYWQDGYFRWCEEGRRFVQGMLESQIMSSGHRCLRSGRHVANNAILRKKDRTRSVPVCMGCLDERLGKSRGSPTQTQIRARVSLGRKTLW